MRRLLAIGGVFLLVGLPGIPKDTAPVAAPAEVILNFSTDGDQHRFHLGELIPVRFSYAATRPDKYILVSQNKKLSGGRGLEVTCSPSAEPVARFPSSVISDVGLDEMLVAPCGGVSGGFGGGCGDCDSEYSLGAAAINFGPVPLNTYVRFRKPGKFTCFASSADVTTSPRDEKIRSALLVKSNPIDLVLVDEAGWTQSAVTGYADAYAKLCRGAEAPERRLLQCSEIAARITYLDTPDSLAAEIRFFDGKNHGWENGFWNAIQSTSHPGEALRLMTSRMQDPDVEVSTLILKYLATLDLRLESPDAFQGAAPAIYHAQAIEKLRKYVRLLGSSLAKKNSDVLPESAKTYRMSAEQKYCDEQPLIPEEEQAGVLAAAGLGQQQ